jgi:predicted ferric reductase
MGQALWFASRATGLVVLLLLTATAVLGACTTMRLASPRWPRFTVAGIHRNISLLAGVFLLVHVAGAVIDPYASIRWTDAVLPFASTYHPFWLGLGAVALDLLLAILVTSLLRLRIPARLWRTLHWGSYLLFPVAVAHGLGIGGSDTRLGWVQIYVAACVVAVLLAVWWRTRASHPDTRARQAADRTGW